MSGSCITTHVWAATKSHIKSRHALNGGPQNKQNALFRSSYVALVMPDTARHGRVRESRERGAWPKDTSEGKIGRDDCLRLAAHRLRPFIMCVFYYPDSWHPPYPPPPPLISQDLVRAFPICS